MFRLGRSIFIFALALGINAHAGRNANAGGDPQDKAKSTSEASATCTEIVGDGLDALLTNLENSAMLSPYVEQMIASDRPTFASLIDPDPAKNLFARAPLLGMTAAQRMLSMVLSQGVERKSVAFEIDPVNSYPFFSSGKSTQGYRIEGNWKAISEVTGLMTAQAEGFRSGRSVPMLFGPGGTGKSEMRTVLEKGAEFLTINDPVFSMYTWDWIGMGKLPEMVKRWGPDVDVIAAQNRASPITLLPPQLQQQALQMAKIKGEGMLRGILPSINLQPAAWDRTILGYLLEHYSNLKGAPLTTAEALKAISQHVRIKRYVVSSAYRQFPILNVQGIDSNADNLMVAANPVVQAISPEAKLDPFAYSYSGVMFHAQGNAIIFEEGTRSDPKFLEKVMDGLESRELQAGNAAKEPWDAFVMLVSNKESYDNLMNKGGLGALDQRLKQVDYLQPSQPQLIARTIFYGFKEGLFMQELGNDKAEWVKADPDKVFPIPEILAPGQMLGPERRYRLRIGSGERAVEISPHALRFMAEIVATTRFETDTQKAYQVVQSRLVKENLFTDPIQRIRYWQGNLTDVTPQERRTLDEMTNKLHEGHSGIAHRYILQWLQAAVDLARSDERLEKTITPSVILKVFEEKGFRTDGFLKIKDQQLAVKYKNLGRLVLQELLIPAVTDDIQLAYSADQGAVAALYREVLEELFATDPASKGDPNATKYYSQSAKKERTINRERVAFIREYYKKRSGGLEIPLGTIFFFHANQTLSADGKGTELAPEITNALAAFMAKTTLAAANAAGIREAIHTGTGSSDNLKIVNNLIRELEKIGYNRVAALDAFDLDDMSSQPTQDVPEEKKTP